MGKLYDRLTEYGNSDMYPFHMPGHKRQCPEYVDNNLEAMEFRKNVFLRDITEISGFDNLHNPEGILLDLTRQICRVYSCKQAWVSLNGSTGGILMAISAVTKQGEEILIARNSHQAVYHAAQVKGLRTHYVYPKLDGETGIALTICPEDVELALKNHPETRAVVITSPTYEGVCSDLDAIAEIAHAHGAKLIVDSAHGAHLGFCKNLPPNALESGADIVIMSTHKTLPAITQTAIVCANVDDEISRRLQEYYDIYMSSSPSYLMMCSVEYCMDVLEASASELFDKYCARLQTFRANCADLKFIKLWTRKRDSAEFDEGKIVITCNNSSNYENASCNSACSDSTYCETKLTGLKLAEILREEYHLETEMASMNYVIAMTSIYDSDEGFRRLEQALHEIDAKLECTHSDKAVGSSAGEIIGSGAENKAEEAIGSGAENRAEEAIGNGAENRAEEAIGSGSEIECNAFHENRNRAEQKMTLLEAMESESEWCRLNEAVGKICACFVYAYPPGIPILAPGEYISEETIRDIFMQVEAGITIGGLDYAFKEIRVIRNYDES